MTRRTIGEFLLSLRFSSLCSLSSLFLALVVGCASANSQKASGDTNGPPVVEIQMTAQRFQFTPSRIEVKQGTRLVLKISSLDGRHGFNIIGTPINVVVPGKGQEEVTVVFRADQRGEYRFKCSKVCGSGHSDMNGVIVVR